MAEFSIGGCDPLPPETSLTIGYHPEGKVVLLMFKHPDNEKGFYWPISLDDARKMMAMVLQAFDIGGDVPRRLDS